MVATRDLKVGNDVAKMAALGRYAEEFIIYAASYIAQGQVCHRVSSDPDELWRFAQSCRQNDCYPTLVEEWVNRTLVPSGERENYLLRSKITMAQKMKRQYPEDYLLRLTDFANCPNTNEAAALLWQWQDELIGCFDRPRLDRFGSLVQYAYDAKKLAREQYLQLQSWLEHIFRQMSDDLVIRRNFKRTFCGFGYESGGRRQYFANAKQALVEQKRQQLLSQGQAVTPLWRETYWYDFQPNLAETKKQFLQSMTYWYDDEYWQRLQAIDNTTSPIDPAQFAAWLDGLDEINTGQRATAIYYKTLWGI